MSHNAKDASDRLAELEAWFRPWDSALVAYSGGVDSTVALAVAGRVLGERAMGCLAVSPSLPDREKCDALALAGQLGLKVRQIQTHEINDARYARNDHARCYFCKSELYGRLRRVAEAEGWAVVVDGTNASDLSEDDRPGHAAARQQHVRSPLADLRMSKDEVRALAKYLDLSVWNKPATACLASRIPRGVLVTPQLLQQIERAEQALSKLGFRQYRVRHHGTLARIEVGQDELKRAVAAREQMMKALHAVGYEHVCLDLAGYRMGSANRPAPQVS